MSVTRALGALAVVVALGAAGFFLGRELLSDGGTQARDPSVADRLDALKTDEARTGLEPRFVGELLGIHLAPSRDQIPDDVIQQGESIRAGGCEIIDPGQAGQLNLHDPLVVPEGYVLAEAGVEGSNPWAEACGGTPYLIGWRYQTASGAGGIVGTVTIVRSVLPYDTQDVAESLVSIRGIGGTEAIIVRPPSPDGLGQRTLVYLPESFGKTAIHAFNLPESDVLGLAEAIVAAR